MFTMLAVLYIVIGVYRLYFQQMLMIEWRTWLTERYLGDWLKDRAYYRMQLLDKGTDNPDQRIADDLNAFVDLTLTLSLGLLSAVVTLVSFVGILWGISGRRVSAASGIEIPGYMVWVALVYAIVGTWLTHLVGRPLVGSTSTSSASRRISAFRWCACARTPRAWRSTAARRASCANFRARFASVISATGGASCCSRSS